MKTVLPAAIASIDEAKALLTALTINGEEFHPEDDATDIDIFTDEEGEQLNKLMADIYRLPGDFDPCEYLLSLSHD